MIKGMNLCGKSLGEFFFLFTQKSLIK